MNLMLTTKRAGDLVYVPSQTRLHWSGKSKRLQQPAHLLITAVNDIDYYCVSHDGGEWLLDRKDALEPKGEKDGD